MAMVYLMALVLQK